MATNIWLELPLQNTGTGVSSLNGLTGPLTLVAGTNITIVPGSGTLTINSTSSGGVTAVTASSPLSSSGGATPNITIQNADTTHTGALTSTDWNTFNNKQSALTLGDLTDVGTDGITVTNGTGAVVGTGTSLSQHVADVTHNGYLASADWSTFNNKQPAGSYITALTGDVTASGPGSVLATLANIPNKVYVDFISGNDSNTGTLVKPWKTLQHAYNSISPSVNEPYVIYLSGGNNDTDVGTITGKSDVSIIADYQIQVNAITITFPAGNSNGCTFVNLTFVGPLTSIRTDGLTSGVTFINCQSFSGPIVKNTSTGTCSVTAFNSQFLNSEFQFTNGGFGFFDNCTFYGTTTFDDPGSSGFSYIQFSGGYSSGTMSFTGLYNPIYFTGFVHDVAFGAAVSFSAGTAGPSPLEIDSNGLPPTFTGTPGTITYLSRAQYEGYTPSTSSNWPSVPSLVSSALDDLSSNGQPLRVSGTRGSPNLITAAGGITGGNSVIQVQFIAGNGGPITVTANPQISASSFVGQQLILTGTDNTNTVTLSNGTGLELSSSITLKNGSKITLMWDGSNWGEVSRNGI